MDDILQRLLQLHFEFASIGSLVFILIVFLGFIAWLSYITVKLKTMATKKYLSKCLEEFKQSLEKNE